MENLEQTVEKSFLGRIKGGLGKIKNSAVSTVAVYSLAGVLSGGFGLGYGCGGGKTIAPQKDALNSEVYQGNPKYCETDDDCVCLGYCDCGCYNKDYPPLGNNPPKGELCLCDAACFFDYSCICKDNTCVAEENVLPDAYPADEVKDIQEDETLICTDNDKDGYGINCDLGEDCDDNNKDVHQTINCNYDGNSCSQGLLYEFCLEKCPIPPEEICDGKDNDCNGKTDEDCEPVVCWEKTFGGYNHDAAYSIQQTNDGGYIAAGSTTSKGAGDWDAWVLKLDENGELEWDETFGGSNWDRVYSIQQTKDLGYIVAGETEGAEYDDAWVFKLKPNGELEWEKTFGENYKWDEAYSIQQTKDLGYIVAGGTRSKGAGYLDAWVFKLDSKGDLEWDKTFGGESNDWAKSIQQTSDGGYIVAGKTWSKGAGYSNAWVLKLKPNGELEWDKTFGGESNDWAKSIQQTSDGGYIVAGGTLSKGAGGFDAWVLKLDSNGNSEWDKTFGGSEWDYANSIQQTVDLRYIVAGTTYSKGAGGGDAWVLKLSQNGELEWDKTYGGEWWDAANSIQQTTDGGYIVAGYTESKGAGLSDAWVLKLDQNGNLECE